MGLDNPAVHTLGWSGHGWWSRAGRVLFALGDLQYGGFLSPAGGLALGEFCLLSVTWGGGLALGEFCLLSVTWGGGLELGEFCLLSVTWGGGLALGGFFVLGDLGWSVWGLLEPRRY